LKNNFKITLPVAIMITLIAVIYQRSTGPTYPKKYQFELGGKSVKIKFPRSQGGSVGAPVEIPLLKENMSAKLFYKRFPTNDSWSEIPFEKQAARLHATLPNQPPAGKLIYYIEGQASGEKFGFASRTKPIVIRYKGNVPTFVLAPHIFFMFLSMLLSVLAALEALKKTRSFFMIGLMTTGCLLVGGMILGPIVQKYAFGVFWAGFPYDWDLTDNKLLISVVAWVLASAVNIKTRRPAAMVAAAVVLMIMYSIPHSTMGSQFNYEKGQVETKTS
jgi:hypothetical protein